jgi:hypothetical protein
LGRTIGGNIFKSGEALVLVRIDHNSVILMI